MSGWISRFFVSLVAAVRGLVRHSDPALWGRPGHLRAPPVQQNAEGSIGTDVCRSRKGDLHQLKLHGQ